MTKQSKPPPPLGPLAPSVYTKPVKKRLHEGADAAKRKQGANKKYPHVIRKGQP
jgi:hypothetical protein